MQWKKGVYVRLVFQRGSRDFISCTDAYGEDVFTVTAAERTHSPGLRLPPGHALSRPLGVRGQVINQLAADLVGGLKRVSLLQRTQRTNDRQQIEI